MIPFAEFIEEAAVRGVSGVALAAEADAFNALGQLLGPNSRPIVSPAGFDAGFPDFAYRVGMNDGTTIDLHYEYKGDYKAQMGSMRDWHFDGAQFLTPDLTSESKQELINIMNNTKIAVDNGKRLLADLKKYFHKDVKRLYSGSMTIVKDKSTRKALAQEFANNTRDYQIAKISSSVMGKKIVNHYKTKFKKNLKPGSEASLLFMFLKDKVWLVDTTGKISSEHKAEIAEIAGMMGLAKLDPLKNLEAKLEVRIQPRGLNSPAKPASIDTMANYRLAKSPAGGGKII